MKKGPAVIATHSLIACPVCDGEDFDLLGQAGPPGQPPGLPRALRCKVCGLGVEPHVAVPAEAYSRAAYDAARDHGRGADRYARLHHDTAVANRRFAQLAPCLPKAQDQTRPLWVDVGCGSGAFLAAARRRGWRVLGVEADPFAVRELGARMGLPALAYEAWVAAAQAPAASGGPRAQAVSFFDVLEHLLDPVDALKTAAAGLDSGGVIVVEVPDLDAAADFDAWKHRRITPEFTEHLWHFSAPTLSRLVESHLPACRVERAGTPVEGKVQMVVRKRG